MWSIPACAGEPCVTIVINNANEVYPRVCGGTLADTGGLYRYGGLSPRVRGNQQQPFFMVFQYRSIPACAGEPYARKR